MSKLWYRQPAIEWEEALPVGNGRLGAMIYGGADRELIQVNEESMWFGGAVNRHNPDFKEHLPKVRELLEQGQIRQAEQLMDLAMTGCPESMHSYQTLGEIKIFFENIGTASKRKSGKVGKMTLPAGTENYVRELDLEQGICNTFFELEHTVHKREYFVSHPADCMLAHYEAIGEKPICMTARLRRGRWFDGVQKVGDCGIRLYGNLGRGGIEFAMELRAQTVGGTVKTIGENLVIEGAKEVFLYFTADTTYHYTSEEKMAAVTAYEQEHSELPEGLTIQLTDLEKKEFIYQMALQAFLAEKMEKRFETAISKEYQELKREHLEDYQRLFRRVHFSLEEEAAFDQIPTDQRLQRIKDTMRAEGQEETGDGQVEDLYGGEYDGKEDIGLTKLLFDFGRYLTIAGSREGGLPTTLQGIWNKDFFPSWDSKYTININTEMNYWHVESCNLSECHLPLFDLLDKVRENGRYTAKKMYGCRGFVAHHNTDINGDTAPQDIWYPGSYWVMGGAWLCTHLWMHYQYTKERAFLERALPVMLESALFFVDFLVEKDGYLVTSPSVSPENTYILPDGSKGCCCIGATMDNQILRDLFQGCILAWKELGEKTPEGMRIPGVENIPDLMQKITYCMGKLMPDRISESGRILEWMEDYREEDPGHRHISHLYGLFPAGQITVDKTPELAQAARRTLEFRLKNGGGHTGWSRAWIMNHYASLWDGEKVWENIKKMLEVSTYPNLFDRHPPFQIDGNFGACAAISRMLVQSNEERVVLLPAIPAVWKKGAVEGIRLVGNATVKLSWEEGKLTKAEILALSDYHTEILYGVTRQEITLKAGEVWRYQ